MICSRKDKYFNSYSEIKDQNSLWIYRKTRLATVTHNKPATVILNDPYASFRSRRSFNSVRFFDAVKLEVINADIF